MLLNRPVQETPPAVANAERGEVGLQVKGPNGEVLESYVLLLDTNAIAVLEQILGQQIHRLMPRLMSPGVSELRALLFAALNRYYPATRLHDAGHLIDRVGFEPASEAVIEALTLGFRPPSTTTAPSTAEAPKRAHGRGTGRASSPTRRKRGSARPSSGA